MKLSHDETLSDVISQTLHAYNQGQYRYLNDFIKLNKSGSDILHLEIFPDAKEITESSAAVNAARNMKFDPSDEEMTVVCVGDGRTPRTATMFAFRTRWQCISIDPLLKVSKIPYWEANVQRLKCIPKRIEEVDLSFEKVLTQEFGHLKI